MMLDVIEDFGVRRAPGGVEGVIQTRRGSQASRTLTEWCANATEAWAWVRERRAEAVKAGFVHHNDIRVSA